MYELDAFSSMSNNDTRKRWVEACARKRTPPSLPLAKFLCIVSKEYHCHLSIWQSLYTQALVSIVYLRKALSLNSWAIFHTPTTQAAL
jgi:hypothetical protein